MKYMGSKSRIAKDIVPIIQKCKDDNNIENLILVKSFINDNKQFYNKYKNYNIIEVIYYIPENTISNIKFFIDKILDATKR